MKICIPIRAASRKEAIRQIKKAQKHADFIEVWLDSIFSLGLGPTRPKSRFLGRAKFIFVCRAPIEHGNFRGTSKERIEILKNAILAGAKFVDVGIHTQKKLIFDLKKTCKKTGAKLIISKHFWNETPALSVLLSEVKKAQALGANIVKIATYAKKWSDNSVMFELTKRVFQKGGKIIALAMGEKGKISRIGCPLLGSYLTYVALDDKSKTADGQFTICYNQSMYNSLINNR